MAERVYEGMFLFNSNRYARDAASVSGGVNQMIEKCGGQLLASRLWAEQKLAYPIAGHRKGTYWLTYFRIDPAKMTELNRATQLNNNVLRHLCVVVDERLVDTLVAHSTSDEPTEAATETTANASQESDATQGNDDSQGSDGIPKETDSEASDTTVAEA